jgi:hypothetical protein
MIATSFKTLFDDWANMSPRRQYEATKEIRRLHFELGYTIERLAKICDCTQNQMKYIIYGKQHPETSKVHRSLGQRGCKKPRSSLKVDLWCHLAIIALRHNTAHRGLHPLEIVSSLKAQIPSPLTQAERDILDEVCAKYGYSFEQIPAGRRAKGVVAQERKPAVEGRDSASRHDQNTLLSPMEHLPEQVALASTAGRKNEMEAK